MKSLEHVDRYGGMAAALCVALCLAGLPAWGQETSSPETREPQNPSGASKALNLVQSLMGGNQDAGADKDAPVGPQEPPMDGAEGASDKSGETAPPAGPVMDANEPPGKASLRLTRPGTFELHARGDDLRGVLQLLSLQGNRNIICTKNVQGSVTVDLYGVTFEQALEAVMASSGFEYLDDKGTIYIYTPEQKSAILKSKIKPQTRAFRLWYLSAADAQVLIAPALSEAGSIAVSPASEIGIQPDKTAAGGNSYPGGDTLVVRDVPEALDRVAKLLEDLDVKPEQVLIETTILSAELREDNKLGVNFNLLSGGVNLSDAGATWATAGSPSMTTSAVPATSGINFRTDFQPVSGGMTFGIFGNDVAFFITALETVTDVTVIANPKLMVINKQRGEVLIGQRDGYLTTILTETSATETVEFLETGTRLLVRPFVGKDGYIRMEVHPEDSDGSVQNGLPSQTTTEVTSNILVKDGHTIVIGGLFRDNTGTTKNQVPMLGNMPYVGPLFRNHNDGTTRNEVIILITPHIIRNEVDAAVSRQLRDDVERIRMGQRNGLQWWSSERMAMCYLRKAKQRLRAGDRERALWDIDMALSIRPRFIEAMRLKEQITQKAFWADEARHAPSRYIVERMVMQELGKCYNMVIPPDRPLRQNRLPEDVRKALGIQERICPPEGKIQYLPRPGVEVQAPSGRKPAATDPNDTEAAAGPHGTPIESLVANVVEVDKDFEAAKTTPKADEAPVVAMTPEATISPKIVEPTPPGDGVFVEVPKVDSDTSADVDVEIDAMMKAESESVAEPDADTDAAQDAGSKAIAEQDADTAPVDGCDCEACTEANPGPVTVSME